MRVSAIRLVKLSSTGVEEQPLLSNKVIVVARSNSFKTTGAGYAPNSPVQIWMHSDPVLLDTVSTKDDGTFESLAPLPRETSYGEHTLRVVVFAPGTTPAAEVGAGARAVKESAFGVMLLDDATFSAAERGEISIDDLARAFVVGIVALKAIGLGHASGWIGLLMLLMLIAAYTGDAPLISSRRRAQRLVSAVLDDALSLRKLGPRRYALSAAAFGLVVTALVRSEFVPVYPTAFSFVVLMLLGALDPLAGVVAGATALVTVLLGGGVASVDDLRAAIVMAVTYAGAPMLASAVARRARRTTSSVVSVVAGIVVYLIAAVTLTRVNGALLRAELAIDRWILLLLIPAAMVLAVRCVLDQRYEQQHRRELALRRLPLTLGLIPAALAVLAFVVLSKVLIDDESLLTLLLLGLVAGLRQAQASMRFPRTPTPSRSRRVGARGNASRRPPASRTH